MPRPPRIPGGGGGRFGIPGGGGGRHGIGGGPYRPVSAFSRDPRSLGNVRYTPGNRFGSGPVVYENRAGMLEPAPRRGGAPARKPRPSIPQRTGPSPRERVARKIASKIMEREKFVWLGLSVTKQTEAQQAVLDAAKKAVLTTYEEADHYPSGRDATPEQDRKDREIYGRGYRNAKTAARLEWLSRIQLKVSPSPTQTFILGDWNR